MARIRIGMIGCGQIAQHHLRTYAGIEEAELVVCCDLDAAVAERSAKEFGAPVVETDFRRVLERDDLDAVDVCLHNNLHAPVTVAALRAGKHVYCEKPMAGSYADALVMRDAARETGKHLHIQLSTLYSNETRAAKALIDDGALGDVYYGRSTGFRRRGRPFVDGYGTPSFVQKRNSAGGALYDMGVYHISQILYLMGNPEVARVSGRTFQKVPMDAARQASSGYDVEEFAIGQVRFSDGKAMDLAESWAINLDKFEGSFVVGDLAGIRLEPFGFFKNEGDVAMFATADLGQFAFRQSNVHGTGSFFQDSQRHWIAALQGRVPLIPTAEIALNTMLVSEAIYLSEKLGREVTAEETRAASQSTALVL